MSFSAIIIGVVVDDTIHFLFHYREEFKKTRSYEQALQDTLGTTGRPLLFTTLTLSCGFAVLLFSDVAGVVKFGGLGCLTFLVALAADLFITPAILLLCKPLVLKRP
jgi:predicted RND superfamily exporter protein